MTKIQPSESLKQHILENGCYSAQENQRIYNKWFAPGPRHQFQEVNRKYHLTDKVICDIGCGYGMNLVHCKPDSYGIEVDNYPIKFAQSIGLTVHQIDFMHHDISDFPKVDAVWCSALLEHVESIHTFLRRISLLLKDGGLIIIYVPTIPLIPALKHIKPLSHYFTGYLYSDHINAFTPSTLDFFCQRAGYETLEVSPFLPIPLSIFNHIPILNRIVDGVTYVGKKIPNWEYPKGATRKASESEAGFVYHEWFDDGAKK